MQPHDALTLSVNLTHAQSLLSTLDAKTVDEAYEQFESASDKHFEDNIRVVTQNVMEIEDYMRHIWKILLRSDEEIFHGGSSFVTDWRQIHERFLIALRESQDLAIRLAEKIKVFYEDVLPLFQAENGNISARQKIKAFRRFANADDTAGVNQSMLEDQKACEKLGRDFDNLRVDIASFAASFEGALRKSDEELESRIRDIKRARDGTIEEFRRSIDPFEAIAAFFSGARSSRERLEERLYYLDRELGDTARLLDNVEHLLRDGMLVIHEEVDRIGTKMKVLAEIWAYLRAQAHEAQLNMEQSMSEELPEFLRPDFVKQTRIGYLKLYICVEQYAIHLEPIFDRDF